MMVILIGALFLKMNNYQKKKDFDIDTMEVNFLFYNRFGIWTNINIDAIFIIK